jgi:hypothetical protein
MKKLQPMVGLLLLLIWLPCTMHCQAEALGWLGGDSTCCEQGHGNTSAKPDCSDCAVCSAVESGGYSLPQKVSFIEVLLVVVVHFAPDLLDPIREPAVLTLPASDSTPQFLSQSWTFDRRAAPAPRAPSFLA